LLSPHCGCLQVFLATMSLLRNQLSINVGAFGQQHFDDVAVASQRCRLQRVAVQSTLSVDVGAFGQ
jgi:hypothetical protein